MNAIVSAEYERRGGSMSVAEITDQARLIQEAMKAVMIDGVHFGTIPGCGTKKTLLKPGAEKISLLFRLAPVFVIEVTNLPGGHREYAITCHLQTRDGQRVGSGIGVCTTMESKYRFRLDNMNKAVPKSYWDSRDPALLGGPAFVARKTGGGWGIYKREECDNPSDYLNTVAKIAKKRAHVDAVLTTTAASDIFDQDLEELGEEEISERNARTQRPGEAAVASTVNDTPERAKLVADLLAAADNGTAALMNAWRELTEAERDSVGVGFAGMKKRAQENDA